MRSLATRLLILLLLFWPVTVWAAGNESASTQPVTPGGAPTAGFLTDLRNILGGTVAAGSSAVSGCQGEDACRFAEQFPGGMVFSGGTHATAGSCTSAAFATTAYTPAGNRVRNAAAAIDYNTVGCNCADPGSDTAWVIASGLSADASGNFQRVSGTDYFVDCVSTDQPTLPSDSTWLMQTSLVNGAINTVVDLRTLYPSLQSGDNTHQVSGGLEGEMRAWFADGLSPYIVSGCTPVVPGSGLTLTAFACNGYTEEGGVAYYITQLASAVTVPNSATVWLALHRERAGTPSGCGGGNWTRVTATHYLTCANATQPENPLGGLIFARVTVAGGNITALANFDTRGPLPGILLATNFPGADLGAQVNAAVATCPQFRTQPAASNGRGACTILIPPGTYTTSTEILINQSLVSIWAYGATIQTSGAISGLRVQDIGFGGTVAVYGLKIDHRANGAAVAGVRVSNTQSVLLKHITVHAGNGTSGTYAGILLQQSVAADGATGAILTQIEQPIIAGVAGSDVQNGILIEGASNGTTIIGGELGNCVNCLHLRNQSGAAIDPPNATLITGTSFEIYTTGILLTGGAAGNIAGVRIVGNRFENGTTVFSITGITSQPSVAPFLGFNYLVSNAGTYLNNPNNIIVQKFDMMDTPNIGAVDLATQGGFIFRARGSGDYAVTAVPLGGNRGLRVQNSSGGNVAELAWISGTRGYLAASTAAAELELRGIRGLSGTLTGSANLRGSQTLDGTTPTTVTLPNAEPDGAYFVFVTCGANETSVWVTAKTATDFVINSSGAHTAVCDWLLVR